MERPSGITEIKMGAALLCFISAALNLVKLQLRIKKNIFLIRPLTDLMLLLILDCWSSRKIRSFFLRTYFMSEIQSVFDPLRGSVEPHSWGAVTAWISADRWRRVCVCVSPWSVTSDGSKRIEASSWGNGSRRQNVWYPTRRVKARARITWPQGVDYHPTTAARPEEGRRSSEIQEKDTCQLVLFTLF